MKNQDVREYAKLKGVLLWQIANKLKITDGNFSRRLRHEFTPEEEQKIMQIIDALTEERN